MTDLPQLTESHVRHWTGAGYFERGERYFRRGPRPTTRTP
jgi:uncharacterized Zn finger protein